MSARAGCAGAILAAGMPLALPLQGCTLAAYGLGVATMANDSVARHNEEYASYVRRTEAANARRLEAGLPERKVLSRRAWSRQASAP